MRFRFELSVFVRCRVPTVHGVLTNLADSHNSFFLLQGQSLSTAYLIDIDSDFLVFIHLRLLHSPAALHIYFSHYFKISHGCGSSDGSLRFDRTFRRRSSSEVWPIQGNSHNRQSTFFTYRSAQPTVHFIIFNPNFSKNWTFYNFPHRVALATEHLIRF